jgi:EAL and modified HD-GYP domain-containing signal transduction protein
VVLRARCCELIAAQLMSSASASEYFLLGLCSLLDAMMGQPMEHALKLLPVPDTLRMALLGEKSVSRSILDAVVAFQRGAWDEAADRAARLGLAGEALPAAYTDALHWAGELANVAAA